jgi:SAM-dependent methyltransferase
LKKIQRHQKEILRNLKKFHSNPLLRISYDKFARLIAEKCDNTLPGRIIEVGSGIGNLKNHIPGCLLTDIFPNPWIDRLENVYRMTFEDHSVSHIIMFDVFHHLEFPGEAFNEFSRVLINRGRVIMFEPWMSPLGLLIYGLFHREPVGLFNRITWNDQGDSLPDTTRYYAAQGNAWRVFTGRKMLKNLPGHWKLISLDRLSAISYITSGGYSHKALFTETKLPVMEKLDAFCDRFPRLFATRALIVLEKRVRS